MTINAALFAEAGQVLFGRDWKRPMAKALNMAERTVNRIGAAATEGTDYPINPALGPEIASLLRAHSKDGQRLALVLDPGWSGQSEVAEEDPLLASVADRIASAMFEVIYLRTWPDGYGPGRIADIAEEAVSDLERALAGLGWSEADIGADQERRTFQAGDLGTTKKPYTDQS